MPLLSQIEPASIALSAGLIVVAAGLGFWLIQDRRNRQSNLSEEDSGHFARQDVRRALVVAVLILIAVGVFVGSRMSHLIGGRPNPGFVLIWNGVFLALLLMIGLALFDWVATRRYARRQRRELIREGIELLKDELYRQRDAAPQRNGTERNGRGSSFP